MYGKNLKRIKCHGSVGKSKLRNGCKQGKYHAKSNKKGW
jgi:hypothetical protein